MIHCKQARWWWWWWFILTLILTHRLRLSSKKGGPGPPPHLCSRKNQSLEMKYESLEMNNAPWKWNTESLTKSSDVKFPRSLEIHPICADLLDRSLEIRFRRFLGNRVFPGNFCDLWKWYHTPLEITKLWKRTLPFWNVKSRPADTWLPTMRFCSRMTYSRIYLKCRNASSVP